MADSFTLCTTPSENRINGQSLPMEAHLVHADKAGNLAVVAVMFKEGAENKEIEQLWQKMPKKTGQKITLSGEAKNVMQLLPEGKDYYRFTGSLTTPPCSEGVRWLVLRDQVTISKEQVDDFLHVMHHPNNRPVQPLNARVILK
ncbi:MAG: carbonic anhydrase family protein [Gammaproteobacteria bacterium]